MNNNPELIRIYHPNGQPEDVPACPAAQSDWVARADAASDYDDLLSDVERALGRRVFLSRVIQTSAKVVLQIILEDGSQVIARKLMDEAYIRGRGLIKDDQRYQKLQDILDSEGRLLRWLERSATLPIPRVLYPGAEDKASDFMVQAMLPGEILLNCWSKLSAAGKDCVMEHFAQASIQLFNLPVPQKIGTLLASNNDSQPHKVEGPHHLSFSAPHPFDDIMDYLNYLIDSRKTAMTDVGGHNGHLDELRTHIADIWADIQARNSHEGGGEGEGDDSDSDSDGPRNRISSLTRCVLVHADLTNDQNTLITREGDITGIIDWEYHLLHPAILAAEYPPWLIYDGKDHPRFTNQKSCCYLESEEESRRLRGVYREIVKQMDREYYHALVEGEKLRACTRWLFAVIGRGVDSDDIGCARLKAWMDYVFHPKAPC